MKERLAKHAPAGIETRQDFIKRLNKTVRWLNQHARTEGRGLCRNQKKRAKQVLKLKGARCDF